MCRITAHITAVAFADQDLTDESNIPQRSPLVGCVSETICWVSNVQKKMAFPNTR